MMEDHMESERILFRLTYIFKRLTDRYASRNLASSVHPDFNVTFLPYFMNIGEAGISNHDLVRKILVTKQGVSKTVKELENLGLVYTAKSDADARSIMIYLTDTGKTLYSSIIGNADILREEYLKIAGAKQYENAIDTLLKLIAYHEKLEKKEV